MTDVTPIHPLRQRMIDDMTLRGFGQNTQRNYMAAVRPCTEHVHARSARERTRTADVRQRSQEALKQKARRGALILGVAAGYVKIGRDSHREESGPTRAGRPKARLY